MQLLPGFGKPSIPSPAPPPPPPPKRDDPVVVEAKKDLRQSELRRKGRAATILAPREDRLGEANVQRATAQLGG